MLMLLLWGFGTETKWWGRPWISSSSIISKDVTLSMPSDSIHAGETKTPKKNLEGKEEIKIWAMYMIWLLLYKAEDDERRERKHQIFRFLTDGYDPSIRNSTKLNKGLVGKREIFDCNVYNKKQKNIFPQKGCFFFVGFTDRERKRWVTVQIISAVWLTSYGFHVLKKIFS